nr:hypothetical protein BaRGS_007678 [Batillaria attramentaria]
MADGSDLLHILGKSRASSIVLDPDVPNGPWDTLKQHVILGENGHVTSEDFPHLKHVLFARRVPNNADEDFLGHLDQLTEFYQADVTPDDLMTVFTTSGTTGFSKLVVYVHKTWMSNFKSETFSKEADSRVDLNLSPLGWAGGHPGNVGMTGGTRVLCDVRSGGMPEDLAEFSWQCIQEEKCTTALLLPTVILQLARKMQQQQEEEQQQEQKQQQQSEEKGVTKGSSSEIWKLQNAILGGCPITRAMLQAAKTLSKSVLVIYGGTDVGFVSAVYNADPESFVDHDAGIPEPESGADVKIVDKDDENTVLPVGQLGHILVKQVRSMREYLNDPEATAAAYTPDGYFRTGDIGCFDDRGHLIVHGRGSDAIMRGAYIFYPGWLEARIRACPGVLDVAVVGVPDPSVNEELCACVVLESHHVTIEQVREFVEKDILVSENDPLSPRPRHYLRFESFPMTDTNKARRKDIKQQAAAMLTSLGD